MVRGKLHVNEPDEKQSPLYQRISYDCTPQLQLWNHWSNESSGHPDNRHALLDATRKKEGWKSLKRSLRTQKESLKVKFRDQKKHICYVVPILCYGSAIWKPSKGDLGIIESVQRKAISFRKWASTGKAMQASLTLEIEDLKWHEISSANKCIWRSASRISGFGHVVLLICTTNSSSVTNCLTQNAKTDF